MFTYISIEEFADGVVKNNKDTNRKELIALLREALTAKRSGARCMICGADAERMKQLAQSLGSEVVGIEYCKQALEVRGTRKCENPGHCPGQAQKVMALKKTGAKALLIGNCTDCSNTVMSCAPKLFLPVYHCTDQALRAVNHKLIRKIRENKEEMA